MAEDTEEQQSNLDELVNRFYKTNNDKVENIETNFNIGLEEDGTEEETVTLFHNEEDGTVYTEPQESDKEDTNHITQPGKMIGKSGVLEDILIREILSKRRDYLDYQQKAIRESLSGLQLLNEKNFLEEKAADSFFEEKSEIIDILAKDDIYFNEIPEHLQDYLKTMFERIVYKITQVPLHA